MVQMRSDHLAKVGEMRKFMLAVKKRTAEFRFELLNGA